MRPAELIRFEYDPPSLCHFEGLAAIPAALASLGGGTAAAATAAGALDAGGIGATILDAGGVIGGGAAASAGSGLGTALSVAGPIASLGGTALSAKSAMTQADYEQKVAQANNVALQAKANQDAAAAQRQEVTQQRQTQLALSREQALAGASGGSATDPTVLNLSKEIVQQGGLNALSAAYNGQAAANADIYQGNIDLFKGQQAVSAAPMTALGTILAGVGRFADNRAFLKAYGLNFTSGGSPIITPTGAYGAPRAS